MKLGVAIVAFLAMAPAAQGAVTIGSQIDTPSTYDNLSGYCGTVCTALNQTLSDSHRAADGLTAPFDGVIVRWRINSGSAGNAVELRVLRQGTGTSYTGRGKSSTQMTVSGKSPLFDTRLPIKKDDSIGVDAHNSALVFASNSPGASAVLWGAVNSFPMALPDGTSGSGDAQTSKELLVQAVEEPDADGDTFGDESQDACPANPDRQAAPCEGGGGGGGGEADTPAPVITNFAVKPASFRVGRRALISADLSEPASVELRFALLVPGRVRGGKCVRQTQKVHTGKRCKARRGVGSMVRPATTKLSVVFRGKLSGRARPAGRYRLTAVATDAAGNVSKRAVTSFRLKPAR